MEPAYVTALAALAGSLVGSATSLTTTFLSQMSQRRIERASRDATRRETIYGQFIDEATRLYIDAMRDDREDPTMMISISALLNRMRLFASKEVVGSAERVLEAVIDINAGPNVTLKTVSKEKAREYMLPLQDFSDACRHELDEIS